MRGKGDGPRGCGGGASRVVVVAVDLNVDLEMTVVPSYDTILFTYGWHIYVLNH